MLCSRFLQAAARAAPRPALPGLGARLRARALALYDRTLQRGAAPPPRRRWSVSVALLRADGLSCSSSCPRASSPARTPGQIFGFTEAAQDISFESHGASTSRRLARDRRRRTRTSTPSCRASAPAAPTPAGNSGRIFIRLKPRSRAHALRRRGDRRSCGPSWPRCPGIRAFLQNPPPIRIGGTLTKSLYQFTLQGPDTDELYRCAPQLEAQLRALPGLQDVTSDLQISNPAGERRDRPRPRAGAGRHRRSRSRTRSTPPIGTRQVSTIYTPTNEYRVILELQPEYQRDPGALSQLYVRSVDGNAGAAGRRRARWRRASAR